MKTETLPLTPLFLPPPFDEPATLVRILGAAGLPIPTPATLAGHALRSDSSGIRVGLVPSPDDSVRGVLVPADADARSRLDFVMTVLGADRVPVSVVAAGGPESADAYCFAPAEAPAEVGGLQGSAAPQREAIEEVMGHFGRRDAAAVRPLLAGIAIRAIGRSRAGDDRRPGGLSAGLGADAVEEVERDYAYANYFGVEEYRLRHRRFDGATSDVLRRAVFTSGDAVTVLPFDPASRSVLLIEQFRAGPYARRDPQPWSLETVAGRCDRDEPPETTARREAREEAGLELGRLERIVAYYPSPGIMSEYITAFVGEADLNRAGGTHGLAEEHEDIRSIVVPLATAMAAAAAGEINNAPLILSLYWLDRHADRLVAAWRADG